MPWISWQQDKGPKDAHVLRPGPVTVFGRRDFEDAAELRIWMWGVYLGLARRGPYNRGREGQSEAEGGEVTKEGVGGMPWPGVRECGQPLNAGKGPEASRRNGSLPMPGF